MTRFNQWIVGNFAAKYDAFPSVHILVTSLMLTCDWPGTGPGCGTCWFRRC